MMLPLFGVRCELAPLEEYLLIVNKATQAFACL